MTYFRDQNSVGDKSGPDHLSSYLKDGLAILAAETHEPEPILSMGSARMQGVAMSQPCKQSKLTEEQENALLAKCDARVELTDEELDQLLAIWVDQEIAEVAAHVDVEKSLAELIAHADADGPPIFTTDERTFLVKTNGGMTSKADLDEVMAILERGGRRRTHSADSPTPDPTSTPKEQS